MIERTVRQWCRIFKHGRKTVYDEERTGRLSEEIDDLVQSEIWRFRILELSCVFPQISPTVLYEIITATLACHKFCVR
jgi:hypothetical protein